MARTAAHLNAMSHSCGDIVVLGIASPTSWDLGPHLHNNYKYASVSAGR